MKTERQNKMWRNVMMLVDAYPVQLDASQREDGTYTISATQGGINNLLTGQFMNALFVFCEAGGCDYAVATNYGLLKIIIAPKK